MKHLNLAELILHCRQNNEAESYFFIHASYLLVMNLPAFFVLYIIVIGMAGVCIPMS